MQMTNGQWLRHHRFKAHIGLKRLAAMIGLDFTWISRIENDRAQPQPQYIRDWALAIGCDPDELFYRYGYMPPDLCEVLRNKPELRTDLRELVKG